MWEPGRRLPGWGRSSGWVPAVVLGRATEEGVAERAPWELFAGALGLGSAWAASALRIAGTVCASAWVAFAARTSWVSWASTCSPPPESPKLPALYVGAPRPPGLAAAPAAPTSSARPSMQTSFQRRPRSATKLVTIGLGHASLPKLQALACLPQELSLGGAGRRSPRLVLFRQQFEASAVASSSKKLSGEWRPAPPSVTLLVRDKQPPG